MLQESKMLNSLNIMVTGANGFVGHALVNRLLQETPAERINVVVRRSVEWSDGIAQYLIQDFNKIEVLKDVLKSIDVIVHCAARVHVMKEKVADPLEAFREVNVQGSLSLARQAAKAGVRRFIFISSVKVNGEKTVESFPFIEEIDSPPQDPYGLSKWEAENKLLEIGKETGMEVVIVRPPLIYGPGVRANFASMIKWVRRGIPLPLGALDNSRSLVAIDNLVDFLIVCTWHPRATGEVFFVSDGEDVSVTRLLRLIAEALNKNIILIPIPKSVLKFILCLCGKKNMADRLCESLQIDISKSCRILNWTPPAKLIDSLKKVVEGE